MDIESFQLQLKTVVEDNLVLKHQVERKRKTITDSKNAIAALTKGSEDKLEGIKLMFLGKKTQLINIINDLKSKVNSINKETEREITVRDEMLHREQKLNRHLRAEVVKAKDVLMSDELTMKARNIFKKLVDLTEEDKVLLEDGDLHEILD